MTSNLTQAEEKLHLTTKLAYGAGDLGPAVTANIAVFYLLDFLINVAGLPPSLAGNVLMIGKIADAVNDPIIGVWSDRLHTRWGRRLPWMLFAALPFGLIHLLQWIVPDFGTWGLFFYYVLIGILFNITYTAINLPYQALTPELTQDYQERTILNSFRFSFSIGGSIFSFFLFIILSTFLGDNPRQLFFILGLLCSLISVISTLWSCFGLQERGVKPLLNFSQKQRLSSFLILASIFYLVYAILHFIFLKRLDTINIFSLLLGGLLGLWGMSLRFSHLETHLNNRAAEIERDKSRSEDNVPILEQIRIAFSNRPFLYVTGIYLFSWLAVQLTASILAFYIISYMQLERVHSGLVPLTVQGTALVMLFFWQSLTRRLDKKMVYFLGMLIWIIAQVGLFLLQPGQIIGLYILAFLAGCGVSVAYLIPWSMIPDVIDLDELETGKRREGVFYAFMVLLQKIGLALGLFLVGKVLGATGFVESLPGKPAPIQPESAIAAIRFTVGPLPALFLLGGIILCYFYPITRQVHEEIRQRLQERT
jgi:GPH family glycoside/pentoside/hexuronide:cation symporter